MDKRSKYLRKLIIRQLVSQGRGHVGSALSSVEILRVLYDDILRYKPKKPDWKDRDRLIFSKGHGCLALYAILADKGFFPKKELDRFCEAKGILGGHPEDHIPGVEWSTGSLGHGLPVAIGISLAIRSQVSVIKANNSNSGPVARVSQRYDTSPVGSPSLAPPVLGNLRNKQPRVYVVMGDGECDEGSVWEAALIAGKYRRSNLTVIIDFNKIQSYGKVEEVQELEPFFQKWESFGFAVVETDGHDIKLLRKVFTSLPVEPDKPSCVICHTVKGKGVRFIEHDPTWHHKRGLREDDIKKLYAAIEKY